MNTPLFADALRYFLRLGFINFGGPAGQIALMHRELVEQRRWLDEAHFQHALNYCTLLPGPEAMQLATYIGWLWGGVRLGFIAGLLFVLPGAILLLALATLYVYAVGLQWVQGFFAGLQAAVLALIVHALFRLSKRSLTKPLAWMLAVGALAAQLFFSVSFVVLLIAAVALALIFDRDKKVITTQASSATVSWRGTVATLIFWSLLWGLSLYLCLANADQILVRLAILFSQSSLLSFGGAYAVLPYVHEQMVDVHHLLSSKQMMDGLALGESTPGPLILVNVFVAFLAGWNAEPTWWYAITAGLIALWFNFLPSFLFIFVGAPWVEKTRHMTFIQAPLRAINAVVIGMLTGLFLTLLSHVLGPWQALAFDKLALIVLAAVALIRWQWNLIVVLLICGVMGIARVVVV